MPNLLRIIQSLFSVINTAGTGGARRVWGEIRWHQRMTVVALVAAILLPVVMYLTGMIVGWLGWVSGAKFLLAAGAATAALLSTLLWVRIFAYGYLLTLFSKVLRVVSEAAGQDEDGAKGKDLIPRAELDKFLVWLRSWTAWYAIAGILLAILPLWSNIVASMLLFAALLGASATITGKWSEGPWARRFAMAVNTSVLVGAIALLVNQRIIDAAWDYGDRMLASYSQQLERESSVEGVRQAAQKNRNKRDTDLISRFQGLQGQLEQRSVDGCEGYSEEDRSAGHPFCSSADKRAHASFAEKIRRLEAGTYWNSGTKRASSPSKQPAKATASASAPPVKGTAGPAARLAPPPSLPGGAPPPRSSGPRSSDRGRSSGGGGGVGPVPNVGGMDWDYILAPLPPSRR